MSRTIRKNNKTGLEWNDGVLTNAHKDKKSRKSFIYRGEGWSTKAQGGVGNKRAWKNWMPRWLYKKYKKETI